MFIPKLFNPLKDNWQVWASLITIVLIAIGSIQTYRANKWEREALRLDGKLEEQQADQDMLYGEAVKERAAHRIAEAERKKLRAELVAEKKRSKKDRERAKQALAQEKKKTAAMPPTELVAEINQRIGDESILTGAGLFLFTRLGTNRTLDQFKDGEFYLSEYNKFQGVLANHKIEIKSFNDSISECEEAVIDNLMGWEDCRETLATALAGRAADKKMAKASVWRGRKQGAFWIAVIACGLKLLGVW